MADFTISDGLITNSSGAISFDNENLTTTGDISAENVSATTVTVGGEQINSSEASLINNITNVGFSQNSKAVTQSSTGVVTIGNTAGSEVIDVASHNGTNSGLKLGGELVKATAAEINQLKRIRCYCCITSWCKIKYIRCRKFICVS